ncbi:hypothetical protein BJ322DRAFT_1110760 [Thelephora terrestris]|uniref:Uncharacterized protein n=1 Tax=Thelephora terrestris TaxID=56493 RepID=A0A9P6L5D1_9AGAM|nr:hypothetical protein BJ322DRAFT_1110760 [Thelephora terrestris]
MNGLTNLTLLSVQRAAEAVRLVAQLTERVEGWSAQRTLDQTTVDSARNCLRAEVQLAVAHRLEEARVVEMVNEEVDESASEGTEEEVASAENVTRNIVNALISNIEVTFFGKILNNTARKLAWKIQNVFVMYWNTTPCPQWETLAKFQAKMNKALEAMITNHCELIAGLGLRDDNVKKAFDRRDNRLDWHLKKIWDESSRVNELEDKVSVLTMMVESLQDKMCRCDELPQLVGQGSAEVPFELEYANEVILPSPNPLSYATPPVENEAPIATPALTSALAKSDKENCGRCPLLPIDQLVIKVHLVTTALLSGHPVLEMCNQVFRSSVTSGRLLSPEDGDTMFGEMLTGRGSWMNLDGTFECWVTREDTIDY